MSILHFAHMDTNEKIRVPKGLCPETRRNRRSPVIMSQTEFSSKKLKLN